MGIVKVPPQTMGAKIDSDSLNPWPSPPPPMKGPPSLIMNAISQKPIEFSIMVTTISLVLKRPLRKPGMDPISAPPRIAPSIIRGMTIPGAEGQRHAEGGQRAAVELAGHADVPQPGPQRNDEGAGAQQDEDRAVDR